MHSLAKLFHSKSIYFWICIIVVCMVVLISDGRILLSQNPYLFGLLKVPWSTLEETAVYAPYIARFDLLHFFRLDYTGPSNASGLAPYPYFIIAILGIAKYLAFGNVNQAIFFIHLLIVVKFIILYWVVWLLIHRRPLFRSLIALFLTLSPIYAPTELGQLVLLFLPFIPIAVLLYFLLRKSTKLALWQYIIIIIVSLVLVSVVFTHLFHHPFYSDTIPLRIANPLLSSIFFYATLWAIFNLTHKLEDKTQKRKTILLCALLFVSNFYVYYLNYLLLAPLVFVVLLKYSKRIFATKWIVQIILGSFLLGLPFLWAVYQTWSLERAFELKERASLTLCPSCTFQNYPFVSTQTLMLYIILWVLLFAPLIYMLLKDKKKSLQINYILIYLLCWTWLVIYAANYLIRDFIPQPILLYRYRVPLVVLAYLPIIIMSKSKWLSEEKAKWTVMLTILLIGLSVCFLMQGQWKYQLMKTYMLPANAQIYKDFEQIKPYMPAHSIFVSDFQAYNILAPIALKARTFQPSAINTVGSHDAIINSYMIQSKLLWYSSGQLINYLTYSDSLTGEFTYFAKSIVDAVRWQASSPIAPMKKLQPTYPMTYQLYLEENQQSILDEYQQLTIEQIVTGYPNIALLIKEPDYVLPSQLEPYFTLKRGREDKALYVTKQ